MKSIKAIDIDSLYKIATSEYVEYYNKAVAFKDFEFIHLMINEDYIYTTEQYLFLKEKWHRANKFDL
jgi:hypothetical protein